jgi:hypothetical protein
MNKIHFSLLYRFLMRRNPGWLTQPGLISLFIKKKCAGKIIREREGRRDERLKESELEGELQRRRNRTEKRERLESERECCREKERRRPASWALSRYPRPLGWQ